MSTTPPPPQGARSMLTRFFNRIFGYRSAAPRSTGEMSRVLRVAAKFSDTSEVQALYTQAADSLDRVIAETERHSDAPSRDAMAYALGRAELDLGDKLTELIEVSKEDHMLITDMHATQARQGEAAGTQRDEFQAFVANLTLYRDTLETWRQEVDATLAILMARLEAENDVTRAAKHQQMCDQIAELNDRIKDMSQRIKDLEDQLVAEGPRVDQARN
jgi:hypothetical protein